MNASAEPVWKPLLGIFRNSEYRKFMHAKERCLLVPDRVHKLVVLSVPHPLAPPTMRQREMVWYQLFFQFEGIAEAWLQHDEWALFRQLLRGDSNIDLYFADLSRPGALTASLN